MKFYKLKEGFYLSNDINFEYVEDFVDYIVDEIENDEGVFITIIAKFDEAKEILKNAMAYDDVNFESLQIESPIMDNYYDEFVLSFWMNDGVLEMGCAKLKNEEGDYTNPCGDVVFFFDNCSSKIIPICKGSKLYFVSIEDECDCDEDCDYNCPCECHKDECCVECSKTEDGDVHGFTVSKSTENGYHSYSFYSNEVLSEDKIYSIFRELGF